MKNYRKVKVDGNQKTIVDDLRKQGVIVEILGDPLDTIIWLPGRYWGFCEIKVPGSAAKFTRKQIEWIARTAFPVVIVTEAAQAMTFLRTGVGLSRTQKDRLAAFLMRNDGKYFTPNEIDAILWPSK